MSQRNAKCVERSAWSTLLAICFLLTPGLWGCLQQDNLSADVLTSFEESSPAAGDTTDMNAADHKSMIHRQMPAGAAANAAILGETPATKDESAGQEEHVETIASEDSTAGETSSENPSTGTEPAVGVPEFHPHQEMPPGFGSNLPAEPQPEEVPAPAGEQQPSEQPEATEEQKEARPNVETPFEREYQDKPLITVSGKIEYDGATRSTVDIDCFVTDTSTKAGRKLVNKVKVPEPGPFSMKVPKDYGELYISAFIDLKGNGPDSKDPQGTYEGNPLEIKDKDIENVEIVLKSLTSESP